MDPSVQSAELLAAVRGGDLTALKRLLALHHPKLRSRVYRKVPVDLRPKVSPEDILQEVYLEVARRLGDFRHDGRRGAFYRWLCRICSHKIVDACRRYRTAARDVGREFRQALRTEGSADALLADVARASRSPSRVVAATEQLALLEKAFAQLPDHYRELLQLRYAEGLTVAATATRMSRSVPATQMLLRRALARLAGEATRLGLTPEDS